MNAEEQRFVLDQLAASERQLMMVLDGLSAAQWRFREQAERWSIAEVVEHLVVFEDFIRGAVERVLLEDADPERSWQVDEKDLLVLRLAKSRGTKFTAREATRPNGRWESPGEIVRELQRARAQTVAFVREGQAGLRDHFFPHIAFGDLDCYQWLVLLGQHMFRHVLQIEEIQADPAYPA